MTGYTLTVTVPSKATFDAYYYGYGSVVSIELLPDGRVTYVVDYGLDHYHMQYQEGRFASGLYFCQIGEYSTSDVPR